MEMVNKKNKRTLGAPVIVVRSEKRKILKIE